jgi:DNA-directed RNA polymerase specialized sigma24 family protein
MVDALGYDFSCTVEEAHDSAVDALFVYIENPFKFKPWKGRLSSYLMSIAKRKLIDRYWARSAERQREECFLQSLAQGASNSNVEMDHEVEAEAAWKKLEQALPDKTDQQLLNLMLAGERSTRVFARLLGLTNLPQAQQRIIVKRHRDRLQQALKRLRRRFFS